MEGFGLTLGWVFNAATLVLQIGAPRSDLGMWRPRVGHISPS